MAEKGTEKGERGGVKDPTTNDEAMDQYLKENLSAEKGVKDQADDQ